MIVFHEGLPGAGKSYEACVNHILPALKAGRVVVTNIEGINLDKFALLTGIPGKMLIDYLIPIYDYDVEIQKQNILAKTPKDSLLVIDEIQNLFPQDRVKLSPEWNKFISEHRHQGIDIILMGQDRRDCHAMWRRRIQRVILFLKLDAVGLSKRYRWELFEATSPEKYKKIQSGTKKYEKQYFGLYESYVQGAEHKKSYTDKRGNIFSTKAFMLYLPLFIGVLIYAGFYIKNFFTPATAENVVIVENVQPKKKIIGSYNPATKLSTKPKHHEKTEETIEPPLDVFDAVAAKHRIRMSGLIHGNDRLIAKIDLLDKSNHQYDSYDVQQLKDLGWSVELKTYGLELKKQNKIYVARSFPLDDVGRVNRDTREKL